MMDNRNLCELVSTHEEWLMNQVLKYSRDRNYTKYTSTLAEAWRTSIAGLSTALVEALQSYDDPPELGPDDDFTTDPIASFGILEAQKHRARGVSLGMFLGLMKYYRQSYIDLVLQAGFEQNYEEWCRLFTDRFFDRLEIGFTVEWTGSSRETLIEELQATNRLITNEKNKYLTIFESLSNPVLILNSENHIDNMNHAALSVFHGSKIPGAYYYGHEPGDEGLGWLRDDLELFLAGSQLETSFESILETPDGPQHFEVKFKIVLDVSGKFSGTVIMLNPITDRKLAEKKLETSLHYLNQIIEFLPDATWVIDNQGRVTAWNRAIVQLTGMRAEDIMGRGNYEHSLPFYGERRPALMDMALRGDETFFDKYISVKRHDDGVWVSESYHPGLKGGIFLSGTARVLYDAEGRPSGAIETLRNITDFKMAEKALKDSERRSAQIIEFLPDATLVIDGDGVCIAWNKAITELTGVDASVVLGKGDYEYALPFYGRRRPVMIDLVIKNDQELVSEYLYVRREGDRLVSETYLPDFHGRGRTWLWNTAAPLYDDDGRVVGAIEAIRDVSDLKRAEEERLELERRLFQSQKLESLGIMAGGIAHNFNNLLQVVLGNLELALLDAPSSSRIRSKLQRAFEAAERSAQISGQMLAYTGSTMFVPAELDLNQLVQKTTGMMKSLVPQGVTLNLHFSDAIPPVAGDEGHVQQVITNLTTNAFEAVGDGPGEVRLTTGVMDCDEAYLDQSLIEEKARPGRFVFLDVTDTGPGMDSDTVKRLFDPFFTTKFTGRGLGLAAVFGIVTGHSGAILVDSTVGAGTTIRVLFPVPEKAHEKACAGVSEPESGRSSSKGLILVVDDEDWVRDLTVSQVEYLGYATLTAVDGDDAVHVFREHADEIDCILLDLSMPNMSGDQTFRALLRIKPDVKVLLASGYNQDEALSRFGSLPPAGFIHKPHDLQTLEEKLDLVLGQST